MENKTKKTYTNHSGGAVGADFEWGRQGAKYGVVSRHYWHGKRTPYGNVEITEEEFEEGRQHVLYANRVLHRRPEKYMDLLVRDWCQVKYSDAVYAIGYLQRGHFNRGTVDGGTGWAVQMAIDEEKPVYLFDQELEQWLTFENGEWVECDIPVLTRDFAGIGSRKITECGIRAISEVYKKMKEKLKFWNSRRLTKEEIRNMPEDEFWAYVNRPNPKPIHGGDIPPHFNTKEEYYAWFSDAVPADEVFRKISEKYGI